MPLVAMAPELVLEHQIDNEPIVANPWISEIEQFLPQWFQLWALLAAQQNAIVGWAEVFQAP